MIKHDGSQENEATNKLFLSILNRFLNNIEFKVLCKKYSVLRSSNQCESSYYRIKKLRISNIKVFKTLLNFSCSFIIGRQSFLALGKI